MTHGPPVPLTPVPIRCGSEEFDAISSWPFEDAFVKRLLLGDIPQRVQFNHCQIYTYRDPDGRLVGFGTLDILCQDCQEYTGGKLHAYIPLLAVNPTIKSLGFGTSIVRHLTDEAAIFALTGVCHDVQFLDAYTTKPKPIQLYEKCGFARVSPEIPDPEESGITYVVMAKRVSMA